MLSVGRNEGVSLSGMSQTTRTIDPDVSRIGAIDTKAFLFAACFFSVCEGTMRFTGTGRIGLRN